MQTGFLERDRKELDWKDWLLVCSLTFVWLLELSLQPAEVLGAGYTTPAFIPAFDRSPRDVPVVVAVVADVQQGGDPLERGDELLAVDGRDLTGIRPLEFQVVMADALHSEPAVRLEVLRDGQTLELRVVPTKRATSWAHLPSVIGYAMVALIVLLRAPGSTDSRLFFAAFMSLAIWQTNVETAPGWGAVFWRLMFIGFGMAAMYFCMRWLIRFPRPPAESDPRPRVPEWVAFICPVLFAAPRLNYYTAGPLDPAHYVAQSAGGDAFFALLILMVLGWNYYCVDAAARRKIRWVLFGVSIALVPTSIIHASGAIFGVGPWLHRAMDLGSFCYAAIPISLLMAMRYFNLYDIDRVITGSVWYTLIIVLIALLIEGALEPAAEFLAGLVGANELIGQLLLAAVLAALAVPLQRRLRPHVEAWFFPRRANMLDALNELVEEIARSSARGLRTLAGLVGPRLEDALRVEDCRLYVEEEGSWERIYPESQASPALIASEQAGEIKRVLRDRTVPIRLRYASDADAERARAFRGLGFELVVPFQFEDGRMGFCALGPKRTLDVYTNTEVSLIAGVAVQVALAPA